MARLALQALVGLANQMLAGLGEHDDGNIVRNEAHARSACGTSRYRFRMTENRPRLAYRLTVRRSIRIHQVGNFVCAVDDLTPFAASATRPRASGDRRHLLRMRRTCCTASCWAFAGAQCNAPEAAAGRCSLRWTPRRLPRDQTLTIDPDPSLLLICKVGSAFCQSTLLRACYLPALPPILATTNPIFCRYSAI